MYGILPINPKPNPKPVEILSQIIDQLKTDFPNTHDQNFKNCFADFEKKGFPQDPRNPKNELDFRAEFCCGRGFGHVTIGPKDLVRAHLDLPMKIFGDAISTSGPEGP